ncbi:MAG: hypothetical protein KDJ26_00290 [Alphaproteobacteria bacterium]|jgi:hypothetical protein|nr:hypothetical protein [Alphaproteobacteria bacterium]MCB1550416.1 hypothetical protein [Alphaproteobacteria bacterium]MCB9985315.1 hypothetical protein [Micavibrio sp.]HRK98616.1 hypothetical protein [Alphaproteobacteria bacterium]
MFTKCDFILGENDSIIVIVPMAMPKDQPLVLEVHNESIVFMSGENRVADIPCARTDVLQRLISKTKVGLVEFLSGAYRFPAYISVVADIEVMIEAA